MLACCLLRDALARDAGLETTIPTGAYDAVDVVVGPALADTKSFVEHRKRRVGTRVAVHAE